MSSKNVMNIEMVDNSLEKLRMYRNDESLLSENLLVSFNKILNSYKTDNYDEFNDLLVEVDSKFNTVMGIHNDNLVVLAKNRSIYSKTVLDVTNIFDNGVDN